jgi:hypothetical protein
MTMNQWNARKTGGLKQTETMIGGLPARKAINRSGNEVMITRSNLTVESDQLGSSRQHNAGRAYDLRLNVPRHTMQSK